MKQNLLTRSILTLVMLVMSVSTWAFVERVDGILYSFNEENHTARVVSESSIVGVIHIDLPPHIDIPPVVSYGGSEYTVVGISSSAFYHKDIESVKIPNTVTTIEQHAFWNCPNLTSVDLGGSVKTIEPHAFEDCEKLTSITNSESIEYVGEKAFKNVPWVDNQPNGVVYVGKTLYKYNGAMPENTSITIKDGTVQICRQAFDSYKNLVSVTLPNTVTRIEYYAFHWCTELASISIPQSVSYVDYGAFSGTKWLKSQPKGVVYINNVLYCYNGSMPVETSINVKYGTTLIAHAAFEEQVNLTSISLPKTVTEIGTAAFEKCKGLTSIDIPTSVTEIREYAFEYCGLRSVTIPNSVTNIGAYTFKNCSNLESVNLPKSINEIELKAFTGCINLKEVTCLNEKVPKVIGDIFEKVPLKNATLLVHKSALEAYGNASPWNQFGTIKTVEELADAVAPTISNKTVTVAKKSYSGVLLRWNKATDNFTPQEDLMYSVYVNGEFYKQKRGMINCIITDLKPSTTYTFEVLVEDYRGNVSKYNTVQTTTEANPVAIEKYPVFIEGEQLTSENANDFWGDGGTVRYEPATKTLTLSWADLYSSSETLVLDDETTISLIGVNQIGGAIYANTGKMVTIKADDRYGDNSSLIVKGSMYGRCELTIEGGCSVEIDATGKGTSGLKLDDSLLLIDKSALKVKGDGTKPSIFDVTTFVLEGSQFESSHHYEHEGSMFVDANGKEATDEIIIAPIIKKTPMIEDNSIMVVDVDNTSATVAWMAATDDTTPQSELTYYIYSMKYGDSNFTGDAELKGMTSYTYTNLQPGTTYYVSVKVVDKDGNQVFYLDASFTTTTYDTTAPTLIDDEVRVIKVTDKTITLEWTKATDDRTTDDELAYFVLYTAQTPSSPGYSMKVYGANTVTIKELEPSTSYLMMVVVYDEVWNRTEYKEFSVTTADPSAINSVTTDGTADNRHSTSGIRAGKNFRGIIIKNGKKVMVK